MGKWKDVRFADFKKWAAEFSKSAVKTRGKDDKLVKLLAKVADGEQYILGASYQASANRDKLVHIDTAYIRDVSEEIQKKAADFEGDDKAAWVGIGTIMSWYAEARVNNYDGAGAKTLGNPQNVLSFSGGGEEYTYVWVIDHELENTMGREKSLEMEGAMEDHTEFEVFMIGFTLETSAGMQYSMVAAQQHSSAKTQSTTVSFTLRDDTIGDQFDVAVFRDPIFGTPIFKVLSGRSACPHVKNTVTHPGYRFNQGPLFIVMQSA